MMTKTILFTFADQQEQERFLQSYDKVIKKCSLTKSLVTESAFLAESVKNITLDPELQQEGQRATAVFVTGKKIFEGTMKDCKKRFAFEIGSHSGNVEIKEKRGSDWTTIRSRKFQ